MDVDNDTGENPLSVTEFGEVNIEPMRIAPYNSKSIYFTFETSNFIQITPINLLPDLNNTNYVSMEFTRMTSGVEEV